jgi:hypothetical protein
MHVCKRLVGCQAAFAGKLRSYSGTMHVCKKLVGWQAAFAGKPRSYSGMGVPARDWSAVRPPSRAGLAPTVERCTSASDCSAVRPPSRASLAPTVEWVYLQEIGRLSGRLREQARSYKVWCMPERKWSAVRPPSRASLAPTRGSVYTLRFSPLIRPSVSSPAFDLDLLAPSGGRVEAFIWGWARSAVRRSRTHREEVEAKPTGGDAPR